MTEYEPHNVADRAASAAESTTRRKRRDLAVAVVACVCIVFSIAFVAKFVATDRNEPPAPSLEVTEWAQLPEGHDSLDVDDYRGKVLYIYCFQSQCPGCHSHGFPILKELNTHYETDHDVAFMAIQTTFENFEHNSFENAQKDMVTFELLNMPIGHSSVQGQRSPVMVNYGTGATPWVIMLDKRGRVAYNHFPLAVDKAIELIELLKQ